MRSSERPSTSALDRPNMASAAGFQKRIAPSASATMTAWSVRATIAASSAPSARSSNPLMPARPPSPHPREPQRAAALLRVRVVLADPQLAPARGEHALDEPGRQPADDLGVVGRDDGAGTPRDPHDLALDRRVEAEPLERARHLLGDVPAPRAADEVAPPVDAGLAQRRPVRVLAHERGGEQAGELEEVRARQAPAIDEPVLGRRAP